MSDGPAKATSRPPGAPPLDDIILDTGLADTGLAETGLDAAAPGDAGVNEDAPEGRTSQRPAPRDRSSNRVKAADPARKRSKLTLRIPDDEVSRPQLADSHTPLGGVPVATSTSSSAPSVPVEADPDLAPVLPQRIISVNPPPPGDLDPDDTLVLSREELEARGRLLDLDVDGRPAPGIDSGPHEAGWTPYQPMVVDRSDLPPARSNTLPGIDSGTGLGFDGLRDAPAMARIPIRDPQRTMIDEDGMSAMALIRQQHDGPAPVSEDIPIDTDEDESARGFEDAATNPRLPASLDSEEIKLEDGERLTDPGEVAEVDADDLVSIESIPIPQNAPPPLKGGKSTPSAPPVAITAASLMAGMPVVPPPPISSPFNVGAAPLGPSALTPVAPAVAARMPSVPAPAPSPMGGIPAGPASGPALSPPSGPVPPPAQTSTPKLELSLPDAPPPAPGLAARTPGRRQQSFGGYSANVGALAPPPMSESAANRKKVRPWWEDLFNDDFIRTMAKITDGDIARESSFIEESLGCEAGATILDLACGTGRHAVELASRGYQVVGFDLSLAMLARASDEAQDRKQKINFVQGDMREMTFDETFDGVFSWNTSFGYFEDEKNAAVIAKVHRSLKKGGQFLLDVINRDSIIRQAPSLAWFEGDGCICMDEMQIDFITSRMKVKRTLMMDDGRTKEIEYSIRIYSLHELGKLLHDNGFRVAEVSGGIGTPGVFFGCEAPRTLILAEKR
ncbi:MAG: methyltransferase [Labilithrix sp.]|nr:methyltransferase [Labilithrix sp.]